jgi:hypothetical protein
MGIRFNCHACGYRLNVKAFLAGKRGICPKCNAKVNIPLDGETDNSPGQAMAPSGIDQTTPGAPPAAAPAAQPSGQAGALPMGPGPGGAPKQPVMMRPKPLNAGQSAARPQPQTPAANYPAAGPADALTEAPHAVWYVRPPAGGQYGPAAADNMRQWLGDGRVSPESLVWREGWADWRSAGDVFPQLRGGHGSAAPGGPGPASGGPMAPAPTASGPASDPSAVAVGAPTAAASYRNRSKGGGSSTATAMLIILLIAGVGLAVALVVVLAVTSGG